MKPRILLIYTGGTIGMMKDPETWALKSFNFEELLLHIPELRQLDCEISTISYTHPIDSSNMNLKSWQRLGEMIHERYDDFDGFVVLHGSDTMAYTGSALSFMFENLTKPIILTGSQLPIGDLRTDAKENLITTIQLASQIQNGRPIIREVCIYFEYQLYRANRTAKVSADHFEAFMSPNYPPLAISGVHLNIDQNLLWQGTFDEFAFAKANQPQLPEDEYKMFYRPDFVNDVVILKLFPGITPEVVNAICNIPELKGIVLETYGSGNAPSEQWFVDAMKRTLDKGVYIVNVTQCRGGAVDMGKYETSVQLKAIGMVSGKDMTTETALAKMMYLLNYTTTLADFKHYFEKSLRGEVTE
ncbi:asparaginase [Nonlabens marinus]|uniref:asparaginase n=1 Tax=Nonlabens marinus S1-08 TaxID=1454201 RepID=W8VUF0_9FLAO|nr:asparaginase [Nonlabens marinus]BAO54543.1 L-asparaginase [Nonlabens marinus S1-08]